MNKQEAIDKLTLLKGIDLHSLTRQYNVTFRKGKVNKGWAGHLFERYLGLPLNSSRSPNFGSWELKSVPLKYLKSGKLVIKETMSVTNIDAYNVLEKEFSESHLLAKLDKAVVVVRIVGKTADEPSYLHSVVEINLTKNLYSLVKNDYDLVRECLSRENGFNMLTGKMGKYIQPRTKGPGHGSTSRAFYARKLFLQKFIRLEHLAVM